MTDRVRRGQAERRDCSGRGLVEGAIAVVARDGVSAATFEAIGREAGYHRSLATQRFGSKQGLIDAVIRHAQERMRAVLAGTRAEDLRGLQALLDHCDICLRELESGVELRAYFLFLSAAIADLTPLRAAFAAEHERAKGRLAVYIAKGQLEGDIRPEIDVEAAALMVGSLLLGVSLQALVDPGLALDRIRLTSLASLRLSLAVPGR